MVYAEVDSVLCRADQPKQECGLAKNLHDLNLDQLSINLCASMGVVLMNGRERGSLVSRSTLADAVVDTRHIASRIPATAAAALDEAMVLAAGLNSPEVLVVASSLLPTGVPM